MRIKIFNGLCLVLFSIQLYAQDPNRFLTEIEKIEQIRISNDLDITVFTGSSSIRFWNDLTEDCSGWNTVNTGFGGSQMTDLLYFLYETVLRFNPDRVFIYEGDNDIADNKEPTEILENTKKVVHALMKNNTEIEIHFISAKPSPARWELKDKYLTFNSLLKDYCDQNPNLKYVDVWNPMLGDNGKPDPTIFISDSLHMNEMGYKLWEEIICPN